MYSSRCIRCPIKLNCGFIITVILLINYLALSVQSSQDISPMEVDYEDSSKMDIDDSSALDDICLTEGCYNAAQLIRNNINETADPCNNFFDFACGGFVSKAVVSDSKPATGYLHVVQEKVMKEVSELLQEIIDLTEPRIFELAKQYFKTCLDQTSNENIGLLSLSEIVGQQGGWPLILGDSWQENEFDWAETDIKLRRIGFISQYLMKFYVFNDLYNSSRNLLHIAPATLEFHPIFLKLGFNHQSIQIFYNFMVNVAVYLGAHRVRAAAELADVLTFEMQLANKPTYPLYHGLNT
ncbi:neprilysin-2-like [Nasonia vitripennis]|uniref:Peptidase M13 N-terminal domain-containing protein n=1 Tax=Nasonia vitripennis TaxID=7425 RepID=A0A7M7QAI7_NASVI|nr:neprilysin-2-like [Nasonia vitripennis]